MAHHHRSHQDHGGSHLVHFETPEMAAYAELEGEVLVGFVTDAVDVLADLASQHGVEVRHVVDIGSGPGVGTAVLAERFPQARVVAADGSAAMLDRLRARAERLGVSSRIDARQVELPSGLADLGPADVVWASMVLHHVGDEPAALRGFRAALAPGGLLGLAEHAGPLHILVDDEDLGRPGLWARLDDAWAGWFARMRDDLPDSTTTTDYAAMLDAAGFEVVVDETRTLALDAPLDERTRQFAHRLLERTQVQLEAYADPADLAALDVLLQPGGGDIRHRDDARLVARRHLYVARAS